MCRCFHFCGTMASYIETKLLLEKFEKTWKSLWLSLTYVILWGGIHNLNFTHRERQGIAWMMETWDSEFQNNLTVTTSLFLPRKIIWTPNFSSLMPHSWVDNKLSQAESFSIVDKAEAMADTEYFGWWVYQICLDPLPAGIPTDSDLQGWRCILEEKHWRRGGTAFTEPSVTFHWAVGKFDSWLQLNHNPEVLTTQILENSFHSFPKGEPGKLQLVNSIYLLFLARCRCRVVCSQRWQKGIRITASTIYNYNSLYLSSTYHC